MSFPFSISLDSFQGFYPGCHTSDGEELFSCYLRPTKPVYLNMSSLLEILSKKESTLPRGADPTLPLHFPLPGRKTFPCISLWIDISFPPNISGEDPAPEYLIIIIIQVGISALQLHHLDFGHPVLFPLQHEVGVGILTDLLLMAAPVAPSVPPGAVEAPVLAGRRRKAPVSTPELQEGTESGDR